MKDIITWGQTTFDRSGAPINCYWVWDKASNTMTYVSKQGLHIPVCVTKQELHKHLMKKPAANHQQVLVTA